MSSCDTAAEVRRGVVEGGVLREGEARKAEGATKGAQHTGIVRGLGGTNGSKDRGKGRRLAARKSAAVVNVIANATAKRS